MKEIVRSLAFAGIVVGGLVILRPVYYYSKGILAQLLLNRTWENVKRTGHPQRAWSWAESRPVAKLRVPSIKMETVVLDGDMDEAMAFGVSVLNEGLDQKKNIVLSGHRDSFFRQLELLKEGDLIDLELSDFEVSYRVQGASIVIPEDVRLIDFNKENRLTLVTCYPFNYLGSAPKRYIVIAEKL